MLGRLGCQPAHSHVPSPIVTSTVPDSTHLVSEGAAAEAAAEPSAPVPIPLLEPADGVPPVLDDPRDLARATERLAAGTGPIAFDAERASGYRYSQRAYLVQIRRQGAGTILIDPVALPDLTSLQEVVGPTEWVLHAASQDLPCLAELGLHPTSLFDTELAGRLLGYERVGLGAMVERVLGFALEKGHSAADWSTRPLPEPWLRYAALDVELLVELRDRLEAELVERDKIDFARQEFAAIAAAPPREPRAEPWRRTSGIHRARTRRQLAAVRAMWQARDKVARTRDLAPGRVLPDGAIMDAVLKAPADIAALTRLPVFSGPKIRRSAQTWMEALRSAAELPESQLPSTAGPGGDGLPPQNRWAERDPVAAARLARVRAALNTIATAQGMPVENLLEPALARRVTWTPPASRDTASVTAALVAGGARSWQVELTATAVATALVDPPATGTAPSAPKAEPAEPAANGTTADSTAPGASAATGGAAEGRAGGRPETDAGGAPRRATPRRATRPRRSPTQPAASDEPSAS
ncbi:ribonuclease D [Parafrankia sp. EUN1f]|uniref:ribonuclease D n=1 Tax=Parafrankia sp. EUN1f TaxID=102897 RepID=UPI0001C449D0|nr:ribonuclease D [Parafrankia sp. EUN1f]EFC85695.1 3'-5' exonuclease [Parafrankia sp. EUN1f]